MFHMIEQYKYQLDSLEDAHGKAEKVINKIRKVMAEENLLKTGLNFKQEKII